MNASSAVEGVARFVEEREQENARSLRGAKPVGSVFLEKANEKLR